MNVPSIRQCFGGWILTSRRAPGLMAACLALATCVGAVTQAQAQTNSSRSGAAISGGGPSGRFLSHGDQAYRIVRATEYESESSTGSDLPFTSAETISLPTSIRSAEPIMGTGVALSSCSSCSGGSHGVYHAACGGSCGGACRSCGACGGADGCPRCECYIYGSLEVLHMRRENDNCVSSSPDYCLTGCDHELGTRLTIGGVPDCVQGCEVTFLGVFEWDRVGYLSDPNGGIDTYLFAIAPFTDAQLSAFSNATEQAQIYDAQYWSVEANRTYVGWEVAKLLSGIRYIDYQEDYSILSRTATETGFLHSEVDNQMIGYQLGMDLLYPVCHNTYVDFRGRAGVYANFIDYDLLIENAGSRVVAINDDSTKLAGQLEIGMGLRYEFCRMVAVRCGAELWYLTGVATAPDQVDNGILSRYNVEGHDDFLVAGFNYGIELRY